MATGRVNVGGGGGGMNLYVQPNEPTKKEGIWIKSTTPKKEVINDLELWFADKWNDPSMKNYADYPERLGYKGLCSANGKVYVIGGSSYANNRNYPYLYRYDSENDTWTKLADAPVVFANDPVACSIGDKLYVMYNGNGNMYMYDITNNTWTSLGNVNMGSGYHVLVAVGDYIYNFATGAINYSPWLYKYDTVNKKTVSEPAPGYVNNIRPVPYGTDIYMVQAGGSGGSLGSSTNNALRKYDTISQTFKNLSSAPRAGGTAVIIGTKIHLFVGYTGGVNSGHYVFDIITELWTTLPDMAPEKVVKFVNVPHGIMGITDDTQNFSKNFRYNFLSKSYEDGTVIVYRAKDSSGQYSTELVSLPKGVFKGINTRTTSSFDNVFQYQNGDLKEFLPTYYGDGSKWVQFKGF